MWASYIDYNIFGSLERLKRRYYYLFPMIISAILIVINFFSPFIFSVSSENVYSRERFMWLLVIQNTMLLIYLWREAVKNRKNIKNEVIFSKALLSVLGSDMVVGRYAGYEFLVITEILSESEIYQYTLKLGKELLELDSKEDIKYSIKFSLGYSQWCIENNYDYETLINIADNNMYNNKNNKKAI